MHSALALVRKLFWFEVALTLVFLLSPADAVLAAKIWVATWLPMAQAIEAMDVTSYSDKGVHTTLFAVLGLLAARSWLLARERRVAFVCLLALGVATELLQGLIPGRSASLWDFLADAIGLCLGMAAFLKPPSAASPATPSMGRDAPPAR